MDKELKQKIEMNVEMRIKMLDIGTKFCFKDFLAKHNLTDKEMLSLSTDMVRHLGAYIAPVEDGQVVGLLHNVQFVRISLWDKFNQIEYKFFLHNSWRGFMFKLSPQQFVVMTKNEIFTIDNAIELWKQFLNFIKTAKPYRRKKPKKGIATGIIIEEYWKNKLKNLFSRLPDDEETINYLIQVFETNGIKIAQEDWKHNVSNKE